MVNGWGGGRGEERRGGTTDCDYRTGEGGEKKQGLCGGGGGEEDGRK